MYLPSASRPAANRFAIGDLRASDRRLHAKFAHHAVHDDFQVQFAHAGNHASGPYPGRCAREMSDLPAPASAWRCRACPGRPWSSARSPPKSQAPENQCSPGRRASLHRTACRPWSRSSGPRTRRYRRHKWRRFPRACWRASATGGPCVRACAWSSCKRSCPPATRRNTPGCR